MTHVIPEAGKVFTRDAPLSAFMHDRGINMRYILAVAECCSDASARLFLVEEAVVRVIKHKIRAMWKNTKSDEHALAVALSVMMALHQGNLWDQVRAGVKDKYQNKLADDVDRVIREQRAWPWSERLFAALGIENVGAPRDILKLEVRCEMKTVLVLTVFSFRSVSCGWWPRPRTCARRHLSRWRTWRPACWRS